MSKIKQTDQYKSYLRRRRDLATAVETTTKGEWEDDDDAAAVPFHLQDDDATNEHMISDEDWEEAANKGIIYSNTTGSKEIQVIKEQQSSSKRPPPPPPPPKKKNIVKDIIQDHETNIKNEKSNELYKVDPNYNPSKELNHTIMEDILSDENIPADTIFDDLIRGFTFAAFFCLVLYILYKCCYCACVKCGLFPDERVLEARMRRMRLRKKRSYRLANENEDEPPLDTREWAVWMANREQIGTPDDEIWDAGESSDDEHEQLRLDCQDEGFIEFNSENGVELTTTKPSIWDKKGDDNASSDMVLEYGEGTELEDLSHDGRLFDNVDNGQGVVREANKFFEGKEIGKKKVGEVVQKKKERKEKSVDKTFEKAKVDVIDKDTSPPNKEFTQEEDLFDIQQSKGESDDVFPLDSLPAYPSPTTQGDMNGTTTTTNDEATNKQQRRKPRKEPSTKGFSNSIVVEDRKYDEETDILGLFSDEPPPLDLEEMSRIEEKLNNNMKEAKLY